MLETLKDIVLDFLLWFMIYGCSYFDPIEVHWSQQMYLNNAVLFHGEASPGVQNASVAVPEEAVTRLRSLWWRPRIYGALHALAPLGPRYTYFCGHFGWSILKPFVIGRVYLSCGVLRHCSFWSVNHLPWHPEHKDNWVITSCTNEGWCRPKPHDFVSW